MDTYDDRLTFLLPRPVWVNDMDVSYCSSCNNAFGPLRRRHHCRNCGNIFCHECSARNVPLPQLGYGTKPVRVCSGCFDVAYLVTYAIDEDHGTGTQLFGVRGLLELTEKDDEKDLHNMVAYGGVDALIWLCRSSKSIKIHHITTTILAMLAEKESIRPVIITKWALPPLLYLIRHYTNSEIIRKKSPVNSIHSSSNGAPSLDSGNQSASDESISTETRQSIILEIIINCTHTLYQLSRANILSQKEVISEGVLDTLFILASFNISDVQQVEKEDATANDENSNDQEDHQQQISQRITIVQNEAAKAISTISSLVPFQASIIESIQGTKKFSSLLRSSNDEVRKYMAKTIAYLSLRNDKYKPNLLGGDGSKALVSILATLPQRSSEGKTDKKDRLQDLTYYLSRQITVVGNEENLYNTSISKKDDHRQHLNSACVSHACCALANFATNNESQINLMSQPHFLKYICNVPLAFPTHAEIHRHVARLLANLALYEENIKAMLTNKSDTKDGAKDSYNVLPTLLFMGQLSSPGVQRHIVRAIDNLSSNLPVATIDSQWKELFDGAYMYIRKILEEDDGNEKDVDTIKRAKSIIAREKYESKHQQEQYQDDNSSPEKPAAEEELVTAIENTTIEDKQIANEDCEEQQEPKANFSKTAAMVSDQHVVVSSTEEEEEEEDGIEEEVKKSARQQTKNKKKSKKNKKMD